MFGISEKISRIAEIFHSLKFKLFNGPFFRKFKDFRLAQIATLGMLFIWGMVFQSWHQSWPFHGLEALIYLAGCLLFQFGFLKYFNIAPTYRSAVISALSLTLLLRSDRVWVLLLASFLTISVKFLMRVDGKHFFNPSNFAIVIILSLPNHLAWVSAGQWGHHLLAIFLLISIGSMITYRVKTMAVSVSFFVVWVLMIYIRHIIWLEDPAGLFFHKIDNGALALFSFYMISDPASLPKNKSAAVLLSIFTAILAFYFTTVYFWRNSFFYSLFIISIFNPLLNGMVTKITSSFSKSKTGTARLEGENKNSKSWLPGTIKGKYNET